MHCVRMGHMIQALAGNWAFLSRSIGTVWPFWTGDMPVCEVKCAVVLGEKVPAVQLRVGNDVHALLSLLDNSLAGYLTPSVTRAPAIFTRPRSSCNTEIIWSLARPDHTTLVMKLRWVA